MRVFCAFLLAGIAIAVGGCGDDPAKANKGGTDVIRSGTPVPTATVDELASGRKAYETNCMICHKADGTGGTITVEGKSLGVEDLTAAKIKAMSDEKIIGYMIKGVPGEGMPSFKDKLSEGEMRDIVKYIRREFHDQ